MKERLEIRDGLVLQLQRRVQENHGADHTQLVTRDPEIAAFGFPVTWPRRHTAVDITWTRVVKSARCLGANPAEPTQYVWATIWVKWQQQDGGTMGARN